MIHKLHGATATHRESVPVKETFNGETVWEGIVEVFDLHGHPKANTAYAWSQDADNPDKPTYHFTVFHIPPGRLAGNGSSGRHRAGVPQCQSLSQRKMGLPILPKEHATVWEDSGSP